MERPEKVAVPLEAETAAVPQSVPPEGLLAIARETEAE
jgi:hypothetical protein